MQLLTAKVKSNPRNVTTKHGERSVMDVILPDGTETAIWGPANFQAIHNCSQGQAIQLTKDSKNKLHILENETVIAPKTEPNQSQSKELSNQAKRDIAEYITQQTKLFSFCYAQTALVDNLPNEDRRQVATTLYLQSVKHFNL